MIRNKDEKKHNIYSKEYFCEKDMVTSLYNAVCVGDFNLTIELIKEKPQLINRPCINWKRGCYELPVTAAIRLEYNDLAYLLLSYGSKVESDITGEGMSALQWASSHGNVVLIEILLKHHASVDYKGPENNTALHYAVLYEQLDSVISLLNNGAEQTFNKFNMMPIHLACLQSVTPIVKQFLKQIKEANDLLKEEYIRAFEIACANGRIEVAKMWLTYFEMNFVDFEKKKQEFLKKVNFFKILQKWVNMFENEEVGFGEEDFERDYWQHQQILWLFLSYEIEWGKNNQDNDGMSFVKLFILHPSSGLLKLFLSNCHLKNTVFDSTLHQQMSEHVRSDPSLNNVFRCYNIELIFLKDNSTFSKKISTNENYHFNNNSPSFSHEVNLEDQKIKEDLNINNFPFLTLKELCRKCIREFLSQVHVTNIHCKLPHLPLPQPLKKYLIFS